MTVPSELNRRVTRDSRIIAQKAREISAKNWAGIILQSAKIGFAPAAQFQQAAGVEVECKSTSRAGL
jgi:hypothetical protein